MCKSSTKCVKCGQTAKKDKQYCGPCSRTINNNQKKEPVMKSILKGIKDTFKKAERIGREKLNPTIKDKVVIKVKNTINTFWNWIRSLFSKKTALEIIDFVGSHKVFVALILGISILLLMSGESILMIILHIIAAFMTRWIVITYLNSLCTRSSL